MVIMTAMIVEDEFQSHWETSVPGVLGGRGLGVIMGCVLYSSASVLARVRLCTWFTVWGRAVLAAGASIFYFHILSIKEGVARDFRVSLGRMP
eukprot:1148915-Pelagomonas_calceolata.AAC.1